MKTFFFSLATWLLMATPALAATPSSRVRGVQTFAKGQGDNGPDHLVVGVLCFVSVAAVIAFAAALQKQGRGGKKARRRATR